MTVLRQALSSILLEIKNYYPPNVLSFKNHLLVLYKPKLVICKVFIYFKIMIEYSNVRRNLSFGNHSGL